MVFHFAGRGNGGQRLALVDFAQLLDPRWKAPGEVESVLKHTTSTTTSLLIGLVHSAYNFALGGLAGAFGATTVYPIDLGKHSTNIPHDC